MSVGKQLRDSLGTAGDTVVSCLPEQENAVMEPVKAVFQGMCKIPCRGDHCCVPCPEKANLPGMIAAYHASFASRFVMGMTRYITSAGADPLDRSFQARRCVNCGKCGSRRPRRLAITKGLGTAAKRMEPFWSKGVVQILASVRNTKKKERKQ
jgi:predicted aldo/keto reductase-like oxidoreductase